MDHEDPTSINTRLLAPSPEYLASISVFPLIPHVKKDVTENIDSALSWEQLNAADVNFAIVRPLVHKYAKLRNLAITYVCLVVRSHFISLAESDLAYSNLMSSRAALCELLAIKLLRYFGSSQFELVAVLTTSWSPIAGAPADVIAQVRQSLGGRDEDMDDPTSALEMAIATKSKSFIASTLVQKVVNDIYSGHIIFSTISNRSLLADNYKPRAIEIYDCRKAPFLDHYRLRVPRYGAILEMAKYAILLFIFMLCLSNQEFAKINIFEATFNIFAFAFILAEYTAAREHGWSIYLASMWNVFDTSFIAIFLIYFVLRAQSLARGNRWLSELAFDILACGACILFPRMAFFAIKYNVIILALRGMIVEFIFFMTVAAMCFSGLLFTLWTLASETWSVTRIAWLMVQIWFGNTYLSFAQAESFHPIFGPILMTCFAALSNTLLLTILISILSNTFSRINENADKEYLYQYTITTLQGVKSDALFSYQPPFNLVAYILLLPLSWILTPRALHSVNVFLIRLTSFPILIVISIYERYFARGQILRESGRDAANSFYNSLPRKIKNTPLVGAIMGSANSNLYDAIFDVGFSPDDELFEESDDEAPALRSLTSRDNVNLSDSSQGRRRTSSAPRSPSFKTPNSAGASPMRRAKSNTSNLFPPIEDSLDFNQTPAMKEPSPLTRLFSPRRRVVSTTENVYSGLNISEDALAGLRRVEASLEGLRDLPVQKLKDEMKELQDRQARIEGLLLSLTRGLRIEPDRGPHSQQTRTSRS